MNKWTRLSPFLLVLTFAAPALADPAPAPTGSQTPSAGQRFKQARASILRKRLGLEEKRAQEVEKVLDKYAPERKKLRDSMRDQQKALRELIKKNSDDQAAFKRALDALADGQGKLNALRLQEQAELAKLLTPKQQALLLQVMAHARRERERAKNANP